jgi:hypothetical protein
VVTLLQSLPAVLVHYSLIHTNRGFIASAQTCCHARPQRPTTQALRINSLRVCASSNLQKADGTCLHPPHALSRIVLLHPAEHSGLVQQSMSCSAPGCTVQAVHSPYSAQHRSLHHCALAAITRAPLTFTEERSSQVSACAAPRSGPVDAHCPLRDPSNSNNAHWPFTSEHEQTAPMPL